MFNDYLLPGIDENTVASELAAIIDAKDQGYVPEDFPVHLWARQSSRYKHYWEWFNGQALNDVAGQTEDGKDVPRYPLKINPIRNFARKHTALLFGEVPDTPQPLVKPVVTPKLVASGGQNPTQEMKDKATFYQTVLSEFWQQSSGRSIQHENGLISQFLGGCVFQQKYYPLRKGLRQLGLRTIYPDFFLPIWSPENYWDLLEAFVVYKVPAGTIERRFGMKVDGPLAILVEHWTDSMMSLRVNGKAITEKKAGRSITYESVPHNFGIVPFTYIPRFREGNFYGSSIVDDLEGLVLEYNARFADLGDGVRDTIQRVWVGKNITTGPRQKKFDNGQYYTDLGTSPPGVNHEPDLAPVDPPSWSEALVQVKDDIWSQIEREGALGPIAFGEDEGSQRSALTLAFRMWPSTTVAKTQRTFWTDGLNHCNRNLLTMASVLGISVNGRKIDPDFDDNFDIACDWLPMIPRDREAQVNELILRLQENGVPLRQALRDFGDVQDVEAAIKEIREEQIFKAKLEAAGSSTGKDGAPSEISFPVATTGLDDN